MENNENDPSGGLESRMSRGYFAFPPGWDTSKVNLVAKVGGDTPSAAPPPPPQPEGDAMEDDAWNKGMKEERYKQLKVEHEIATRGEWEWVR